MAQVEQEPYWSEPVDKLLETLNATKAGLSTAEASARQQVYGINEIGAKKKTAPLALFLNQFKNPIIIILIIATLISALTGDVVDSLIILAIIVGSAVLSFYQEYSASNAVDELRAGVQSHATVLRDGSFADVPANQIVPGDIIRLAAGDLIPADGVVLESDDFFVNESILTGEAFPARKFAGPVAPDAALPQRTNALSMGAHVQTGSAKMVAVHTGVNTFYAQIAKKLTARTPETEFERGLRTFGNLLTEVMLILTLAVFAINVIFKKPPIDSLLFSVALAVGITPQLLPAIVNITLSKGSRVMAKAGVIVRRLASIENLGSMDVLCTDKTGTLTLGVVNLDRAADPLGQPSEEVFRLAYLNASLQSGLVNPLDAAIRSAKALAIDSVEKLDENPYDFARKRLGVYVREGEGRTLIVKGALKSVLDVCDSWQTDAGPRALDSASREAIQHLTEGWSGEGYRVLGVATKAVVEEADYTVADESDMVFMGFLLFLDPPKADAYQTILDLNAEGVDLRIITGDNELVAAHTASAVGMPVKGVLTGSALGRMTDNGLAVAIRDTNVFSDVDPNQKERIILALKKMGHVVGYMGDGINDAPALHAADVGISVNTAVDVAKEAADFVLLENDLGVLKRGIELGRITFANTLKYIYITTSANFGNMFSMAGASLFLPFLPLLPKQILMLNFMSDFPAMTIASDSVDQEMIQSPRRWNIRYIRDYMITFGLISTAFDYLTFAVLLLGLHAGQDLFRTGWFVLSMLTELLALIVMRTQKRFYKSKPAPVLLYSTLAMGGLTLLLPYLPVNGLLSIVPMPVPVLLELMGVAALYVVATEVGKHFFYKAKAHPRSK